VENSCPSTLGKEELQRLKGIESKMMPEIERD
jgi:hypothetical protein